jgi:ATP-binding cassette, subfamily G (WHITE), member 2, PDR
MYIILVSPTALPGFWIFMYYLSPLTYLISAVLSTALSGTHVRCASDELVRFERPSGTTCGTFMASYIGSSGGYLVDESAIKTCEYCSFDETDVFLDSVGIHFSERWRNFGISGDI